MKRNVGKVPELEFIYRSQDESISCNFRFLTKNVPAKILYKLLTNHLEEERTYFEYREFKRDRDLFRTPKITNFEVRLDRLMKLMRTHCPQVCFEKIGRGKFTFYFRVKGEFKARLENA